MAEEMGGGEEGDVAGEMLAQLPQLPLEAEEQTQAPVETEGLTNQVKATVSTVALKTTGLMNALSCWLNKQHNYK